LRAEFPRIFSRDPYHRLSLNNIAPLYLSPRLEGEGVWEWKDMPAGDNGWPVIYKTTYRPSRDHPNAVVHMLLFDMKGVSMRLYMGSSEPGAPKGASKIEEEDKSRLLAITNALWKQKHSGGAGTIFRGRVIKEMVPGIATLVIYHDGSVDLVEWNDGIPLRLIRDARQLKHLIVNDGRVVNSVIKHGERVDSEIGLGFLLSEDPQQDYPYWGGYYGNRGGYYGNWGGYYRGRPQVNYSDEWYIATRSAFGIRRDGNLVFAIGHHISTKDLARALVLAGCVRAIHGDANPHNVVGNLYYPAEDGSIIKKAKLSPDQKNYTLNRYVNRSYTSDFFGFFRRPKGEEAS